MKMKKTMYLVFVLVALLITTNAALAADLEIESVKINGDTLSQSEIAGNKTLRIELDDQLDIRVKVVSYTNETVEDVEVAARLVGYDHADKETLRVYDVVSVDELDANDVEYFDLTLDVPKDIDKEYYTIRLYLDNKDSQIDIEKDITLNIVGADNRVDIKRISFDPAEVVAGRALRTRVKLENYGEEDEDDVYITVAIPALGSAAVVTADIEELDEGDTAVTEDLLLRIPECAKAGVYDVEVTVEFDDGYESTTKTAEITVVGDDTCNAAATTQTTTESSRTVITPPESQEVNAGGSGVSFPVVISNEGNNDKTYTVTVTGVSAWGSVEVTNPAPLVKTGDNEVVYVYVSANKDVEGKQVFEIEVSDGEDSRSIPVVANVVNDSSFDLKNVLYIGIIVLLVLVIILGLVIGFRKSKDEDKEYY